MPWYATECPANPLSDRVVKPPFASEVSLGSLHGDVSQWELELFQLTTRLMTERDAGEWDASADSLRSLLSPYVSQRLSDGNSRRTSPALRIFARLSYFKFAILIFRALTLKQNLALCRIGILSVVSKPPIRKVQDAVVIDNQFQ